MGEGRERNKKRATLTIISNERKQINISVHTSASEAFDLTAWRRVEAAMESLRWSNVEKDMRPDINLESTQQTLTRLKALHEPREPVTISSSGTAVKNATTSS